MKDPSRMQTDYGKLFLESIKNFSKPEIAKLLKQHGVIAFKNENLNNVDHIAVMSGLGTIQNLVQQKVPFKYGDSMFSSVVNMSNDDFLKETRTGWHIDHTYNGPALLPLRSLCQFGDCDPGNVTEFKDLEEISKNVIEKFPDIINARAVYRMPGQDKFNNIPLTWNIPYIKTPSVRFDSRIVGLENTKVGFKEFREFCLDIINNDESIPTFSIEWEPGDIVIFDNNRSMHRRSVLLGNLQHKRITCDWHKVLIEN